MKFYQAIKLDDGTNIITWMEDACENAINNQDKCWFLELIQYFQKVSYINYNCAIVNCKFNENIFFVKWQSM